MTEQNALIDLSDLGLLRVSGVDAKKLLQGQLTCDLEEITNTQHRLGAHCNSQGRIISLFRLFLWQDHYYLQMPRESIPLALAALKKYAVFFKVQLTDESDAFSSVGIYGNLATTLLTQHFPALPAMTQEAIFSNTLYVMKLSDTLQRYAIIGEPPHITLLQKKLANNLTDPMVARRYLDISNGIPNIYAHTSEKLLPHEINLPQLNAISFTKGCYTGQEIIARMQYRGKLKKHLYQAVIDTPLLLQPGADFQDCQQNPAGMIVDCLKIGYNKHAALVITDEKTAEQNNMILG